MKNLWVISDFPVSRKYHKNSREVIYISGKKIYKYAGYFIFWVILLGLTFPILGRQIYANDGFKALYTGRYISLFNQFAHHSTYTFHSTLDVLPRDTFNWLGNLAFLGIHQMGGLIGLQIFRNLLFLFVLLVILVIVNWRLNPLTLLFLVFFSYGISQKLLVRTAIFTVPLSTSLLLIWYLFVIRNHTKALWFYPPILVLWSNLHGSYMMGVGFLGVLLLGEILDNFLNRSNATNRAKTLITIFIISIIVIPIVKPFPSVQMTKQLNKLNPFNNKVLKTLDNTNSTQNQAEKMSHSLGQPHKIPEVKSFMSSSPSPKQKNESWYKKYIKKIESVLQSTIFPKQAFRSGEFRSPFELTRFLMVRMNLLGALLIGLFVLFLTRWRLVMLLPYLAVTPLALGYMRVSGYMSLLLIPLALIEMQRDGINKTIQRIDLKNVFFTSILCIGLLSGNIGSIMMSGDLYRLTGNRAHRLGWGTMNKFRPWIPKFALKNFPNKRIFNSYNLGSFLIWHWWPHKKVFVDTKWSAYHPSFQRYYATTPLPRILREETINYAITERRSYWTIFFIESEDWSVYETDSHLFFYEQKKVTRSE